MSASEILAASKAKAMELEIELSNQEQAVEEVVEETTEPEANQEVSEEAPEVEAETTTETAEEPVVEAEKPAEADQFEPKFEILKRREKALRQREQDLKESQVKYKEWEDTQSLAKKDPMGYLEKAGISYDDLTNQILNGGEAQEKSPQVTDLEARIAKFEESEKQRSATAEQQKMQNEASEYIQKLNAHIDESESYELIKATESHQLVVDTISEHYRNTQEELKWETACGLVEDHLWETEVARAKRVISVNKMREKLGLDQETPEELSPAEVKKPKQTKTLSNTKTAPPTRVDGGKPLTFKDSLEKAKLLEEQFKRKS